MSRLSSTVAGVALLALALLTVVDAIGRKLGYPLPGGDLTGQFLMAFVSYFGFVCAQVKGRHIRVDILPHILGRQVNTVLDVLASLLGLSLFTLITWFTGARAWASWLAGEYEMVGFAIPITPMRIAVVGGAALLSMVFAANLVRQCALLLNSDHAEDQPQPLRQVHSDRTAVPR